MINPNDFNFNINLLSKRTDFLSLIKMISCKETNIDKRLILVNDQIAAAEEEIKIMRAFEVVLKEIKTLQKIEAAIEKPKKIDSQI